MALEGNSWTTWCSAPDGGNDPYTTLPCLVLGQAPDSIVALQNELLTKYGACNPVPGPTDLPFAYPMGVTSFNPWSGFEAAYVGTCDTLIGTTPDCPTTGAGGCLFEEYNDASPDPCDSLNGGEWAPPQDNCNLNAVFCAKKVYDAPAWQRPCCLGGPEVQGFLSIATPAMQDVWRVSPNAFPSLSGATAGIACDPRWCPSDNYGACEGVFAAECVKSVQFGGGVVNAMLGDPALEPCAAWYQTALAGEAPLSRWPVIDTIIEHYCANPAASDSVSCACFDYQGQGSDCASSNGTPCYLYTSVSGTPRPVLTVDAQTSATLNFSDAACIVPACVAGSPSLLPSDVWHMHQNQSCPDTCLQVVADGSVYINGDMIPGGVFINITSLQCAGALASITTNTPFLATPLEGVGLFWPWYSSCSSAPGGGGNDCCPGGSCPVETIISFALASAPTASSDLYYSVSVDGLPPGVTVQNPSDMVGTLSWAGQSSMDVVLQTDARQLGQGQYVATVTIGDTRSQYASTRATSYFTLTVASADFPPPPPGPIGPNPGTGPATNYIDTTAQWAVWILYGLIALVVVLGLWWLLARGRESSVKTVIADVLQSAPALAPAPVASYEPPLGVPVLMQVPAAFPAVTPAVVALQPTLALPAVTTAVPPLQSAPAVPAVSTTVPSLAPLPAVHL